MPSPEGLIINDIQKTLEILPGVYAWRNNTGAGKRGGGYVQYGKKGSGDFLGLLRGGRFLAIEAKVPGEKQTADQIEFQREVENKGGLYLLVESGLEIIEPIKNAIRQKEK